LSDLSDVNLIKFMRHQERDPFIAHVAAQVRHVSQRIHFVELTTFNQAVICKVFYLLMHIPIE
jgi:hypothetical protein